MSEETVKAFTALAQVESDILRWQRERETFENQLAIAKNELKEAAKRKRELLKVVKITRTRKPKPEPKRRGRPVGSKNKGKGSTPATNVPNTSLGAESKGEPTTIDPAYMQTESAP